MVIRHIKDSLIQIPWISKLGTGYQNLFQYKWNLDYADMSVIENKYADEGHKNSSDKTFFIVHERQSGGIFVYLVGCMVQIAYALQKGYVPVVDMLNFPTTLRNDDQSDINAWELYFKQPADIGVQDVYGAEHILFHGEEECRLFYVGDVDSDKIYEEYDIVLDESKTFSAWYDNKELMKRFQNFWRAYVRYSDNAKEYIEQKYQELFSGKKRILGVLCRGTDYISLKPKGHYVQPSVDMIIAKIREVMNEYRFEYVFCATEDAEIYHSLKKALGNRLFGLDTERVHYKKGYLLCDLYKKQKMDIYRKQLNYLTEMELLSRCQGLIAGKTTGSRYLPVMKDGEYEYLYYWELGRYH